MTLYDEMKWYIQKYPLYDINNLPIKDVSAYIFKEKYGEKAYVMPNNQEGFDVVYNGYKIETKWRTSDKTKIDITKPQYDVADIIGLVSTRHGENYTFMTKTDYVSLSTPASGRNTSKFKDVQSNKWKLHSTRNLVELTDKLLLSNVVQFSPEIRGNLSDFMT